MQAQVVEPPADELASSNFIGGVHWLGTTSDNRSHWGLRSLFDAHITQVADNLVGCAIVLRDD